MSNWAKAALIRSVERNDKYTINKTFEEEQEVSEDEGIFSNLEKGFKSGAASAIASGIGAVQAAKSYFEDPKDEQHIKDMQQLEAWKDSWQNDVKTNQRSREWNWDEIFAHPIDYTTSGSGLAYDLGNQGAFMAATAPVGGFTGVFAKGALSMAGKQLGKKGTAALIGAASGLPEAGIEGGAVYNELVENGLNPQQASVMAAEVAAKNIPISIVSNAIQAGRLGSVLEGWNKAASGSRLANAVKSGAGNAFVGGTTGAAEEFIQEGVSGQVKGDTVWDIYSPSTWGNRPSDEQLTSAVVGGISGGAMTGVPGAIGGAFRKPQTSQTTETSPAPKDDANNTQTAEPAQPMQEAQMPNVSQDFGMIRQPSDYTPKAGDIAVMKDNDRAVMVTEGGIADPENVSYYISTAQQETQTTEPVAESAAVEEDDLRAFLRDKAVDASQPVEVSDQAYGQFVKRNVDGRLQNPKQAAKFVQDNFADEFAAYKENRQQERAQKSQNAPDVAEFNIQDVGKSADIKGETQDVVPQTQQSPIAGMVSKSRESRQSAALQSQNGLLTKKKDVTKKQSLVDMTRRALAGDQSALQTFNLLRPAEREALVNAVTGKTSQTAMPTSEKSSAIEQQGTVSKSGTVEAKKAKRNESVSKKQKQVDMLSSVNPMRDDYHTGIRSVDDIADTDKVFGDDFEGMYPDFTEEMAQEALSTGKIKVYSSKPIEAGAFVTPSKMNAQDYAGGKNAKVYEKTIPVEDVAWVDESEGQYAPVDDVEIGASSNKPKTPKGTEKSSQKVKEDDTIEFNLATDDKESREYRHEIMEKHGFSKDEIADLDKRIESIAEVVKDVSEKYTDFNEWQNIMSERLREKGVLNPKVNAFIANGEYKLNIDLGTLCIKREGVNAAIQAIIDLDKGKNRLVQHLGASQIWQMCDVLKKNDFLVPCEVCFVESKRVRALDTANAVSLHWKAVLEALGINDGKKIGEPRALTAEQQEKLDRMARTAKKDKAVREKAFEELIPDQYKREVEVKKSKDGKETKTALDNGITPDKMAKIASLMKKDSRLIGEFDAENLLTSQNVDQILQKYHGTGLAGFIAGSDGAATAKPLQGKHVYDGLSFRTAYDKTRNTAKSVSDIGGVRLQSFSDFDTLLFFDYVQAIADLEARRLTAHAYVKIPEFVEFFGETGIKTNMSLLFGISDETDANGNKPPAGLQFAKDKDGNIKYDRSGQPQYEYLFVDESFGAKPGVSGAEGAEMAFGMRDEAGNVGTIGVGLSDEHIEKMLADDRIDMVIPYHASGMPNSIQVRSGLSEATDYSADQTTKMGGKKKDYPFNKKLREIGDPRKTAEDYLAWCEKNGYTPKFPQFAKNDNYYKLLADFRVYDGKGEYAPQKSVQLKLPSNIKTLLDERVSDRVNIVDKVNAIKENKELVQEMVDTITRYERIDGLALSRMKARLNSVLNVGKDDAVVSLRTKEFFNELDRLAEAGKGVTKEQVEVLRTSDKVVYGFAVGGKIYLNENYINAHTPAHEFTHIWAKVVKANNPKLWKQGVNLLKTDPRSKEIWDDVVNDPNYESIRDNEDAVASEVLARIVGGENEKLVKEIFNNANGKRATHTKSFGAKLMDWIKSFFGNVIDILNIDRNVTWDEFVKAPLGAIWDEEAGKSFNKALKKWQKMQDDGSAEMNMDEVSEDAKFQIAYHGTPHIFDEFSLSGVGTGEGAQAHGWGLYFAQDEAVAQGYRERLSGDIQYTIDGIEKSKAISNLYQEAERNGEENKMYILDDYSEGGLAWVKQGGHDPSTVKWFKENVLAKIVESKNEGSLVSVDIPDSDVLLDEQKTFNEQPPKVQNAIKKLYADSHPYRIEKETLDDRDFYLVKQGNGIVGINMTMKDAQENIKRLREQEPHILNKTGASVYSDISNKLGSREAASEALNKHGVKGITYKGGRDVRCFVIFDDKAIEIKRKYDSAIKDNKAEIKRTFDEIKSEVKKAFPNAKAVKYDGNDILVTLPNDTKVRVSIKDKIIVNEKAAKRAREAHGIEDGSDTSIQGYWQKVSGSDIDGVIAISKDSTEGTTYHESLHMAMDLALAPKEKKALNDHYAKEAKASGKDVEEAIADGYAKWRMAREKGKGTLYGKLFQKMRDFWNRLKAVFTGIENAHNVMRRIESGEVWERKREESNTSLPKASLNVRMDYNARYAPVDLSNLIDAIGDVGDLEVSRETVENYIIDNLVGSNIKSTSFDEYLDYSFDYGDGYNIVHVARAKSTKGKNNEESRTVRNLTLSNMNDVLKNSVLVEIRPNPPKHTGYYADPKHDADVNAAFRSVMPVILPNSKIATLVVTADTIQKPLTKKNIHVALYEISTRKIKDTIRPQFGQAMVSGGVSPTTYTLTEILWNVKGLDGQPYVNKKTGYLNIESDYRKRFPDGFDFSVYKDEDVKYSVRKKAAPKKTVVAYKLFKVKKSHPGKLFPLFVDANKPAEMGVWLDADVGEMNKQGKVKSKLGGLAFRPGWHAGDYPVATHIGKNTGLGTAPAFRNEDQVWAEVEMAADVDWQEEANRRAERNKKGEIVPRTAHITDQIPEDGFYRYKTNPNMTGTWLIGGSMKINRILTDEEVYELNERNGVHDLPRERPFEWEKYGFDEYTGLSSGETNTKKFSVRQTKKEKANSPTVEEVNVAATNNLAKKLFKGLAKRLGGKKTSVEVEERKNTQGSIGLFSAYLASPSRIAEKVPAFKNFFQWASNAMEKETKLRSLGGRKLNAAFDLVSGKEDRESLIELLWSGDSLGKEWTREELLADGVKENVADAYIAIRRLMNRFYREINDARTRKQTHSKVMSKADARELEHNKFVTRIISKTEEGQPNGKVLVTYESYAHWEREQNGVTADVLMSFRNDDAIQVLDVEEVEVNGEKLYNVKIRERIGDMHKRTGYIPHFFHEFFIVAQVKDENGEVIDKIVGSARSQADAVKEAEAYQKEQEKMGNKIEGMIVRPKQFNFASLGMDEGQVAATVGDIEYARMVKKLQTENDMTIEEAKDMLSGLVKQKNRHRYYGNMKERKGVEGYEKDMEWVLRHFVNSASRYVALETEFKPQAISYYERRYGAFDKDPSTLSDKRTEARYIKDYISDINGNPSWLEEAISKFLSKVPWLNKRMRSAFGERYALHVAGQITSWTSILKLGVLNISSALINLSQLANASVLISDNPAAAALSLAKAMKRLTTGLSLTDKKVLIKTGVLEDIGLDSGSGYGKLQFGSLKQAGKSVYGAAKALGGKSMWAFKKTEELVRRSTVLAAYEQGKKRGMTDAEAIAFAKEVNRKANFDYGVQDAPNIFRRGSVISQIVLQFKKYGIKEMEFMLEMTPFIGKTANAKQKAAFWAIYILGMAGLWQTPLIGILDDLISFVTGGSIQPLNWAKGEVYSFTDKHPEYKWIADAVTKGAPYALGIDLSSRTGMAEFFPSVNPNTLLGVAGSSALKTGGYLLGGDYEAGLRSVSPSLGNVYSAVTTEKVGKRGRMESKYVTAWERLLRGLGFTSSEEAEKYDRAVVDRYLKSVETRKKQEAVDDYLEAEANGEDVIPYAKRLKELGVKGTTVKEERKRKRMTREEIAEEKEKNKKQRKQKEISLSDYAEK